LGLHGFAVNDLAQKEKNHFPNGRELLKKIRQATGQTVKTTAIRLNDCIHAAMRQSDGS
jgi:hypothetical protein